MKQKMVVNVTMNGQKSRSKALTIAASWVESASVKGDDKTQIEVTGDGLDPVKLTTLLRKSVGHAVLVSFSAVDGEKKKEEKKNEKKEEVKPPAPSMGPCNCQPLYFNQEVPSSYGYAHHCDPCFIK